MRRNIFITISIIVFIIAGWVFFSNNRKSAQENTAIKITKNSLRAEKFDQVPKFVLKDWRGNKVSLADFQGKPLVLNSWALWCLFCLKELLDFARLQEEFGNDIVIVAINRAESTTKQKKFTDKLNVTSKLLFLNDDKDSFYQSIGGFSMPETLFVDKNGNILIHKRGSMNLEEMRKKVRSIL